ncbi:hypothetical protein [Cellulosimicrobium sp. CUA-896]|uniref:hypothetical protein n=1 Tax=Cellulosimicrobium sp. CUA-896 TaxID=1517881 RepID=UPI000968CFFE|nr:hypothetical protein [Cellulosimicrobium sp. CUA-896]OLT54652.1 hypothetical protein BJF88_08070 [Cellulosimicrobium sp. CUA-896]
MSRAIGHAVASLADDTLAVNGVANPELADLTAQARCLGGTAYVAVRATNDETVRTDVRIITPFGEQKFAGVTPGRAAYQSFSSRAASIEAGTVTVRGYTWNDGDPRYHAYEVPYEGIACG